MARYPPPEPIGKAALIGLTGEFIQAEAPYSEADPDAMVLQLNTVFGNCAGRAVCVEIDPRRPQHLNLFAVIVGPTSSRKGSGLQVVQQRFEAVDPAYADRIEYGLSTGEGLIKKLADEEAVGADPPEPDRDEIPTIMRDFVTEETSGRLGGMFREQSRDGPASPDKRLMAISEEFGQTLRMKGRGANTLWDVLRRLFDRGTAATTTKKNPVRATNAHVSMIGHITPSELDLFMTDPRNRVAIFNGEFNRILWGLSERSKSLPRGGPLTPAERKLEWALADALRWCWAREEPLRLAPDADEVWDELYRREDEEDRPEIVARGQVLMTRLAGIYAAKARSSVITVPHLEAAAEVWRYCREAALYCFAEAIEPSQSREVARRERKRRRLFVKLQQLIQAAPNGLTDRELWEQTHRNYSAVEMGAALDSLVAEGLIREEKRDGERCWYPNAPE